MNFNKPPLIINLVDKYILFKNVEFGLTPFVRRLGVVPYENVRVYKYECPLGAVYVLGDMGDDKKLYLKFVYFSNEVRDIMSEVVNLEQLKEYLLSSVINNITDFNIFSNN